MVIRHNPLIIKQLGQISYEDTLAKMQAFTQNRNADTPDEIWFLEHPPVFTLGQAGKRSHLLVNSDIPVIHCDRGGQITYHGPGQLVVYLLLDLKRLNITIRPFVTLIERSIINVLKQFDIESYSDPCAPGVYVDLAPEPNAPQADNQQLPTKTKHQFVSKVEHQLENKVKTKICSIGLRVRKGCSYHGLALNHSLNLTPFSYINPCGFENLKVTQITDFQPTVTMEQVISKLQDELIANISYKEHA